MQLAGGSAFRRVVRSFTLITAVSITACDSTATQPAPDAGADSGASNGDGGAPDAGMCPPSRAQVFGACASTEAGYGGDGSGGWSLSGVSIEGNVDAIARGWSFNCEGLGRPPEGEKSWSFHVRDGSRAMWVGIVLPWRAPFVEVGDKVSVEYRYGTDNYDGAVPGFMTVRDGDGRLLFWARLAYETNALTPPQELDVHDAHTFECNDGCGNVRMSAFQVKSGGDEIVLGRGERGEVGDYVVFHGVNAHGGEMTGDCSDWSVNISLLAAVRGSIASLDARDAKL